MGPMPSEAELLSCFYGDSKLGDGAVAGANPLPKVADLFYSPLSGFAAKPTESDEDELNLA